MFKKMRLLIISVLLVSYTPIAHSQSHKMPEPGAMSAAPPPPVGLPLPIDNYLPLLLFAGLIYGAVKIPKLKQN
jgi:hypothetical protein